MSKTKQTPAKPPPYRFCWSCSRQFHGPFYRVVETDKGRVFVHAACVKDVDGYEVPVTQSALDPDAKEGG